MFVWAGLHGYHGFINFQLFCSPPWCICVRMGTQTQIGTKSNEKGEL